MVGIEQAIHHLIAGANLLAIGGFAERNALAAAGNYRGLVYQSQSFAIAGTAAGGVNWCKFSG